MRTSPPGRAAPESDAQRAWDAFVSSVEPSSYMQLSAWARVKAANGWSAWLPEVRGPDGRIGAQVLLRRPRLLPWTFAYAPRGPLADAWTAGSVDAFTHLLRAGPPPGLGRISHVRVEPEIERDGPLDPDGTLRRALVTAGWRPARPVQPEATRLIDLRSDEGALWAGLRKKWRQYVNRARVNGITVRDAGSDGLGDFYRIYRETARRAGFLIRTEAAYRDIWEAFGPSGMARLLLAVAPDGEPQAALFLVRSGTRVVEPYGGMTVAGAESRANYLLKWEAIRTSKEQGAATYDLWGLAHPGIAHFKTGFGGREVRYIGAWDLVLDPLGRMTYEVAQRARVWVARRRHRLTGSGAAAAFTGEGGGAE